MKFQHLPVGASFIYEGKLYSKTGPMTASTEEGGQRMIPRYAEMIPLDGDPSPVTSKTPATLDPVRVKAAFDAFHAEVSRRMDTGQQLALARGRSRFLAELGLDEG